ncbi:DUF4262 domain-containing protein [Arthrobacter sp. CAU 1506]|uniref:DUF4262 domain-containing protein n=1 Tax=Arthrobacter sp. CAU 1506 TaxID=2560052 RepID=UPI00145F8388|nr:DUF4262 domain-containing protein [Arthrobacter sp. CAU 1506]
MRTIDKYGWQCMIVEGDADNTAFGYTIGLTQQQHPEILVTGRMHAETHALLSLLVHRVLHHNLTLVAGMGVALRPRKVALARIERPQDVLLVAADLYKGRLRGLQAIWADEQGLFPWQQDVPDVLTQPLYGTPPVLQPKPD